ncbi:hypothetical protein HDU83_009101 [Entophlyctis luteolus]|nr:hypothetical protein HDU83_009101 [Entophlyctis luteolus]
MADNSPAPSSTPDSAATAPQEGFLVAKISSTSSAGDALDVEETPDDPLKPKVQLTKLEFLLVLVGLVLAVFLASLDMVIFVSTFLSALSETQTIVSVALQTIASEFSSLDKIDWIGTAFFATSAAFVPVYGQAADVFGRKPTFITAITVFELGSLLCGVSKSMIMLIVSRAIAGIGASGIFSVSMIIIGDLTSDRDRPTYLSLIGATYGLASIIGPILGGAFVDGIGWRWVFFINLPLGVVTIIAVLFFLKLPSPPHIPLVQRLQKIDLLGCVAVVIAVTCLMIVIQGGGSQFAWNSAVCISLIVLTILFFIAFFAIESFVAEFPILPFDLFRNQYAAATYLTMFFVGAAFFILVFYTPLWFQEQIVLGSTATNAGVHSLPLLLAMVFATIFSGAGATSTGYLFPFMSGGAVLAAVGSGLMTTMDEGAQLYKQVVYLLIAGIGVGSGFQMCIVSAQVSVSVELLALSTSTNNFIQSIGLGVGVAVCSAIFNNNLVANIADALEQFNTTLTLLNNASADIVYQDPSVLHNPLLVQEGSDLQLALVHGYLETLRVLFYLPMGCAVCWFLSSLFIKKSKIPMASS